MSLELYPYKSFLTQIRSILCVTQQLLLDLLTDSNETWRVYAVHPWLLQRQLFDFRF